MASPPLTNREYAYLRISSERGDHSIITNTLGVEPTNAWNKGDVNPHNDRVRNFTSWQFESGLDDRQYIEQHLDKLFEIFEPLAPQLKQLSDDFDIQIQCVGYFPPSGHGIHLKKSHVQKGASLCASFDLDFYYVNDFGHDLDYV